MSFFNHNTTNQVAYSTYSVTAIFYLTFVFFRIKIGESIFNSVTPPFNKNLYFYINNKKPSHFAILQQRVQRSTL